MKPPKIIFNFLVGSTCVLFSMSTSARHGTHNSDYHDSRYASFYYTYEANGDDYITGVGASVTFIDSQTNLGFSLNTSLNNAEVLATDGYVEDYFAWEGSIKFGYFSKLSIYGEVGVDLTEALFHDLRYHDDDDDYYHHHEDDIDAYFGAGIGINLGGLKIDGFSRLREIDSRYWEAESEVFSGIQVSINF